MSATERRQARERAEEQRDRIIELLETIADTVTDESDAEDPETKGDKESEVAEPPLDPAAHTVSELRSALDDGAFSRAELDALAQAEEASDDRATALDAIDAARPEE